MKMKFNKEWLLHPSTVFIGIIAGIVIGLLSKRLPVHLQALGKVYLALLSMCILPIVMSAVISSLGHLLHSHSAKKYLQRLFFVFLIGMVMATCLGVFSGVVFRPGEKISAPERVVLGTSIAELKNSYVIPKQVQQISSGFLGFLDNIIPTNVFQALSQGKSLPVIFFVILFGSALGLLRSDNAKVTLTVIDTIYTALFKIVIWIMYALPLGLCFLFAGYVHQISWPVLLILIKWVATVMGSLVILTIGYTLILWRYYGGHFYKAIKAMKYPAIVAFGTSSSLVTLPAMLRSLQSGLKVDKYISELVVPLGVHFNLQGTAVAFPLLGIFMGQVYGQPMTPEFVTIAGLVGLFAALSVPAVPGFGNIGMAALVLTPLGLPVLVGMIVFVTAVPLLDPFITFTNVYANLVSTILIARPDRSHIHQLEQ